MYQIRDTQENKIIARFINKKDALDVLKIKAKGKDKERFKLKVTGNNMHKKDSIK